MILADAASMIGGADKVAIVSAIELAKRGHKVTLLASIGPPDPSLEGVENLEVVCLGQPEVSEAPSKLQAFRVQSWNHAAIRAFESILDKAPREGTVLHAHCYLKMLSAGPIKLALDSGLPFAITFHDYGIACPSRIFYHQREGAICHRKPMGWACMATNCLDQSYAMKIGRLARFAIQSHRAKIAERLRFAVFVSEFSQRIIAPYLNDAVSQFVIDNPVDPQKEPRVEASRNRQFVYVGRLVSEKSPLTLAKAARIANVPVVFVGEGPEREKVLAANPDARVTGWVRPDEVHRELRASRGFVIPSIWYECSPLVTVEALSHGLPIVCSDSNASRESVVEGKNGFLFRAGDANDLADKLRRFASDEGVAALSKCAYETFWKAPPSTSKHVDDLETLYRRMATAQQ